jgi:hypothetical protein
VSLENLFVDLQVRSSNFFKKERKKEMKTNKLLTVLIVLALTAMLTGTALADTALNIPLHNDRAEAETDCPDDGGTYWHFVISPNNNQSAFITFYLNLGDAMAYETSVFIPNGTQWDNIFLAVPAGKTLESLIAAGSSADIIWQDKGPQPEKFVLSHVCPGAKEELTVSKTAETSYTREHFWDIAKEVATEDGWMHEGFNKVWLYTDGSGDETATWTVDVTYEDYKDSAWNVTGEITIENTGTLDAVITAVDDVLAGAPITVDCGVIFPYMLMAGETLTCTYDEDGYVEGFNEVTVTTERDTYFDDAEIVWGDPTTEINATVNIKDISDLFGEVDLGTATAPNDAQFTYTKDFAWADYGRTLCGDYTYENEAMIVETEQSASATLKVNVQCMIFKGETAWAANGNVPLEFRYTNKGNWATYVQYAEKCTTLFAGQTIPVGKVCFSAVSGGKVTIKVKMTAPWEYEDVSQNLKVQGYATAPKGNPAPGLFANKKTCDPTLNWCKIAVPANNFYGVHVNVGTWMPDPSFGP